MIQNVLSVADFNSILDDYSGRQVFHVPAVRTVSNISGQETIADGTPVTLKAYFMRTNQRWDFEKMGFLEQGNAVLLAKYADGVVKNDKITVEGSNFRVKEAYNVPGIFESSGSGTAFVYTACNLFLEE